MRVFKPKFGKGKEARELSRFYLDFKDHREVRRRLRGFTDERATREMGARISRLVSAGEARDEIPTDLAEWLDVIPANLRDRLRGWGLLTARYMDRERSLETYLEDWKKSILAGNRTERHARLVHGRAKKVIDGCGFSHLQDLDREADDEASAFLASLEEDIPPTEEEKGRKGISERTRNFYVQALRQFGKWIANRKKLREVPFAGVGKVKVTDAEERRALTGEEIGKLLGAARRGPTAFGMTGEDRAAVYTLALTSGIRAAEIGALTRDAFDLEGDPPTVRVTAGQSKNRKTATLPLRADVADLLRGYLAHRLPKAPAFPTMPPSYDTAAMMRRDLEAAEVPFRDNSGRRADFHALRHTYLTSLARAGVHPSVAKELARHSTIVLTLDRYTHTRLEDGAEAVEKLSAFPLEEVAEALATGTDGEHCHIHGADPGKTGANTDKRGRKAEKVKRPESTGKRKETGVSREGKQELTPGFEPGTCGLQNRCPKSETAEKRQSPPEFGTLENRIAIYIAEDLHFRSLAERWGDLSEKAKKALIGFLEAVK